MKMKKFFSIICVFALLATLMSVSAFGADDTAVVSWSSNAVLNDDGTVTIGAGNASEVTFAAQTSNTVIEFDYEYQNGLAAGNISYNVFSSGSEFFRSTFSLNGSKAATKIYSRSATSTAGTDAKYCYNSYDIYTTKGKIQYIINFDRKMVMIKHIDLVNGNVTFLTNDYFWDMNVASIDKFKIGTSSNPGIVIKNFKVFEPDNFDKYYNCKKTFDFNNYAENYVIPASGDFTGTGVTNKIVKDPDDSSNMVLKLSPTVNTSVFQIRPALKEFGYNGNVYLKYRIRFDDLASTRVPYVVQFGGYYPTFNAGSYNSGYRRLMETIATGDQFQIKKNTNGTAAAAAGIREIGKWYDVSFYFDSDSNNASMYVGDTLIAKDYEIDSFDFINNLQFTANAASNYYIDDLQIGMYTPYTYSIKHYTLDSKLNTITGLEAGMWVEDILDEITVTNGAVKMLKGADGVERTTGALKVGDYVEIADATYNTSVKFALPELFDLSFKSSSAVVDGANGKINVLKGKTADEVVSGFTFTGSNHSVSFTDSLGAVKHGELVNGDILKLNIDGVSLNYVVSIKDSNTDYLFNWDFTSNITPTDNMISQGNTTNGIRQYTDPLNSSNKTLGFITNEDNVSGTGAIFVRYNFKDKPIVKNKVFEFDYYCSKFEKTDDWYFEVPLFDGNYYGAAGSAIAPIDLSFNDNGGIKITDGIAKTSTTYDNVVKEGEWAHVSIILRDKAFDVCVNGNKLNTLPFKYAYTGPENCTDFNINRIQPTTIIKRGGTTPYVFSKISLLDNIKVSDVKPQIKNVKYNPYNNSLRFNYDNSNADYDYVAEQVTNAVSVSDANGAVSYTVNVNNKNNYFETLLGDSDSSEYTVNINNLLPNFECENPYSAGYTVNKSINSIAYITSSYGKLDYDAKTATAEIGMTAEKYISGIDCDSAFTASVLDSTYAQKQGTLENDDVLRVVVGLESYDYVISLVDSLSDSYFYWDFQKGVGTSMTGVTNYYEWTDNSGAVIGHMTDPKNSDNKVSGIDTSSATKSAMLNMRYDFDNNPLSGSFVYEYDLLVSSFTQGDGCDISIPLYTKAYYGVQGAVNYSFNPIVDVHINDSGYIMAVEGDREVSGTAINFGQKITANTWCHIAIVGIGNNQYDLYLDGKKLNDSPVNYRVTPSDNNSDSLVLNRFQILMNTKSQGGTVAYSKKVLLDNVKASAPQPVVDNVTYYANENRLAIAFDASTVSYEFTTQACNSAIKLYDENDDEISYTGSFDNTSSKFNAVVAEGIDCEKLKIKINSLVPTCGGNGITATFTYNLSDITIMPQVIATLNPQEDAGEFFCEYTLQNSTEENLTFNLILVGYDENNSIAEIQIVPVTVESGKALSSALGYVQLDKTTDDGVSYAKAFIWGRGTENNMLPYAQSLSTK